MDLFAFCNGLACAVSGFLLVRNWALLENLDRVLHLLVLLFLVFLLLWKLV